MSQHELLAAHLRSLEDYRCNLAADALEAQEREIEALQTELARALTSARLIREGLKTMREVES